jgi:[protein-PII] uridylyltransferase
VVPPSAAHPPAAPAVPPERLAELRARLQALRQEVRAGSRGVPPHRGMDVVVGITDGVDALVRALAQAAQDAVAAQRGPAAAARAAAVEIVALGGYGRQELCPYSDVDLLFLVPDVAGEDLAPVHGWVEGVLYGLWDLGFEVGQAVRTVEETVAAARQDASVLTSLLDARVVSRAPAGAEAPPAPAFEALMRRLEADLLSGPQVGELIQAKLQEAKARRARFGDSVFLLEPNVKESEGGLRELHTALWVAQARWRAHGVRELVRLGVLSSREGGVLERAYGFLLRVRTELHFLARRRQDHLRFEYQEQIAPILGYVDPTETDADKRTHGVERFMRAYYFHARQLAHHAGLLVERATSHRRRKAVQAMAAPGGFKEWDGKLTVTDRAQFLKDPAALVRIFRVSQEEHLEIYSYTKDLISEHAHLITRVQRRDPAVVRDLLTLLEDPKADGAVFTTMHDLGVLGRLIPELARVTARWQHSLYHVYTVDAHSLVVLKNLKRLRNGTFAEEQREMTHVSAELPRPAVLYLAGLMHDVGKGWPRGDHSVRGELVSRTVGRRLEEAGVPGWGPAETEDMAWLVRHHLAMSDISQRRDLSDRDLLASFAAEVRTEERLDMLYLLTFADMRGTSPKVWTDWKAGLLAELWRATRAALGHQEAGQAQADLHFDTRRQQAERELLAEAARRAELRLAPEELRAFCQVVPARYMRSFNARRMVRHVQMWRDVTQRGGLAVHVRHLRRDRTTKLTISCPDRPGLLALLAGTLAAHRLQILSAQVFSVDPLPAGAFSAPVEPSVTDDLDPDASEPPADYDHLAQAPEAPRMEKIALDVLFVTDEQGQLADDPGRWAEVRADLLSVISGAEDVEALQRRRQGGSRLAPRHRPAVKTEVSVAREDSNRETVIDVFCEDRIGVLYTIAKTFMAEGLSISLAKISTQGHRVADGFYVFDAKTGKKVDSQARLDALVARLTAALDQESA